MRDDIFSAKAALDHDDFGSLESGLPDLNQSKIMNVIDSFKESERDAGGKPLHTFPHPALCSPDRSAGRVTQNKRWRGSYGTFIALGLMLAVFASIRPAPNRARSRIAKRSRRPMPIINVSPPSAPSRVSVVSRPIRKAAADMRAAKRQGPPRADMADTRRMDHMRAAVSINRPGTKRRDIRDMLTPGRICATPAPAGKRAEFKVRHH